MEVTTLVRRVATIEKSVFWTSFSSLTRRKCLDDLIPALKGRAKFMTTLRVALFFNQLSLIGDHL